MELRRRPHQRALRASPPTTAVHATFTTRTGPGGAEAGRTQTPPRTLTASALHDPRDAFPEDIIIHTTSTNAAVSDDSRPHPPRQEMAREQLVRYRENCVSVCEKM
ncbi:hypothetical protein GWK47_051955 [Chionoecetes opilio]|uniref:Uncharacterized protein n=1 Tax=Chionoecetes opilio TaxID=41210 RepID=A0A8J4YCA4_CHIOP|nr:hypothetical protein GWK47_051955 [Chionoecetes opilio]